MKKIFLAIITTLTLTLATTSCIDNLLNNPNTKTKLQEEEKDPLIGIWECTEYFHVPNDIEHFNTTIITLTIDSTTNLVSVDKLPEKVENNDIYHQFRHGKQYLLQNDTLYSFDGFDNNGVMNKDYSDFAITRISENRIELEFLGMLPAYPLYIRNYLFNKK